MRPSKDNTRYKDESGSLRNGTGGHLFVGNNITKRSGRPVLDLDIPDNTPEGSKITGASLSLHMP